MTHITIEKEKLQKVFYALTATKHGNLDNEWTEEVLAICKKALAAPTVQPVAHCEAGPKFCQQCHLEDRSLALAAAVRYVKNNTPKLVSDEICMALTTPPAQPAPVPDATAEEWKDAAWKVWKLARTHNNTIPSHWLDRMRELVITATPPAAQRQWVGLTDEEIIDMYNEPRSDAEMIAFGREVETKLKEKNT